MAKAHPNSKFVGFDNHAPLIEYARKKAEEEGLGDDRITFEVSSAINFPKENEYDLVAFFDCLHDMGDPAIAASRVLKTLKPDGVWMMVKPFSNDRTEDNLNPVGRMYYAASNYLNMRTSITST